MAVERYTFDTNILFYSLDATDKLKHERARTLVGLADSQRVPVLLQTLGELCNVVTKRHTALLPQMERFIQITSAMFAVISAEFKDLSDALIVHRQDKLPFWDAVIWATARRAGCTTLLTEDLQDGRILGGVTFRNPFRMSPEELDSFVS